MMEEAPVVDCPPTPELLPLPNTPPSHLPAAVVYSSSSEEADEPSSNRRSPPPKCAICLGKCRQRAYTNSCRHEFCFRCLLEWSKVKAECPLCKQRFYSIVYNKSLNFYEEHVVAPMDDELRVATNMEMVHTLNIFFSDPDSFNPLAPRRYTRQQEQLLHLLLNQSSEVDRFIREFGNEPVPHRMQQAVEWRRFVYVHGLYAVPLSNVNGSFRESSAAFYRANPAQLFRVIPWMNRELYALGIIGPVMVDLRGNTVSDLLRMYDIDSRQFYLRIIRHIPEEFGEHFQHELGNFARSPFDMYGYDRCVQYNPRFTSRRSRSHVVISSSEEDNDVVYMADSAPSTSTANGAAASGEVANANNGTSAATANGVAGGANVVNANNGTSASTANGVAGGAEVVNANNGSSASTANGVAGGAEVVNANIGTSASASSTEPTANVPNTTGSSSSGYTAQPGGIMYIPTSRTFLDCPLRRMFDDQDVVVLDEPTIHNIPPATLRIPMLDEEDIWLSSSDSDECQFVMAQKPPHLRTPDHVVNLESESDSDVVFVAEEPGRASQSQGKPSSLKNETVGSQGHNIGASTSSGGGGNGGSVASGSASTSRGKYYVRPRLNRYSGGMGVKSIYEASGSDDTDSDYSGAEEEFNLPEGEGTSPKSTTSTSLVDKVVFSTVVQGRKRKRPSRKSSKPKGTKRKSRKRQRDSSSSSSTSSSSSSSSSSTYGNERSISSNSHSSTSSSTNTSCSSSCSSSTTSSSSSSSSGNSIGNLNQSRTLNNLGAEPESGRQLRTKRSQPSSTSTATPAKQARVQKNSKGRTKKKRPSKGGAKRSNTRRTKDTAVVVAKSKSPRKKSKKKTQPAAKASKRTTKRAGTKATPSKASPKNAKSSPPGKDGRRRKASSRRNTVPSQATAVVEDAVPEPAAVDAEAHYFITTRPSSSPTMDPAAEEGSDGRERKLKSVIIKRCHFNRAVKASGPDETPEPPVVVVATPSESRDSTGTSVKEEEPSTSRLMDPEESNTVPSESLFEPSLSWDESDAPAALIVEDRGLSSAAASPFSSISFPPSTTSVSPSLSLSSQSLALPTSTSPVPLVAGLSPLDGESPLPSSVLGIDAIGGAIDEIMASEVVHAAIISAVEEPPGPSLEEVVGAPCEVAPVADADGTSGSTRVEL